MPGFHKTGHIPYFEGYVWLSIHMCSEKKKKSIILALSKMKKMKGKILKDKN